MIQTTEKQPAIRTTKIDNGQYSFLKERGYTKDSIYGDGSYEDLKNRLFEIGGEAVGLFFGERDKENIMTRSESFINPQIKMMLGRSSQCHTNSAKIWSRNLRSMQLYTGYALNEDGVWRQHTWVMEGSTVIETTEERIAYYGYKLNDDEADFFYLNNLDKLNLKILKRMAKRHSIAPDVLLAAYQKEGKFLPNRSLN